MNELTLFDPMMTLVAQNIKTREATHEESLIIDTAWVNAESSIRGLAWLSREGKTWKNLVNPKTGENYTSFEEYGLEKFDYSKTQLHALANAFRVEKALVGTPTKELPLSQTEPFRALPDSAIPETYQHAIELAREEGKKLGAKHVEEAVAEWKLKNESLQSDLMAKVQQLDEKQKRINWLELDKEATIKQNDQLRNDLAFKVEEKVEERIAGERAKLILENQDAIAQAKREAENAQAELERLKKEQAKAIKDGVFSEIQKCKTEIDQLEYRRESLQKQTADLSKARDLLEKENGIVKQHLESISTIGEAIQDIKCALYLAEERGAIPVELINEWSALNYALSGVSKEFVTFCNRESHVINSDILINNLSDLGRTLESEAIFA